MSADPLELDAETMRRLGYRVVDLLVDRIAGLAGEPAWRGGKREELQRRLERPAPELPVDFDEILDELTADVLPLAARVDHPRFMAFVPGSPTWPGVLADFMAGGYNIFQGTWLGSAGPSAVELVVLDWFREWLRLPLSAGGLFLSGGSAANLTALACARLDRYGGHDRSAVIYLSEECHSSVERAARILGFHPDQIRVLPTDDSDRIRLDALRSAVDTDKAADRTPFLIVANAGSTSTGAVDPLPELAEFCRANRLWLHVDAAYGGFAVLTERGRAMLAGLEEADSITLDPHKLLYQPFEAGCLLVRDVALLERAFRVMPVYLQDAAVGGAERRALSTPTGGDGINFGDRGLQLSRSARALKVWVSIQYFGLDRFRTVIDRTMQLADHAERWIRASSELELVTPASFGVVCFRREAGGDDAQSERANSALVKALAESGEGLISSTRRGDRYALRLCILSHRTRAEDVDRVLHWLERTPIPDQRDTRR